MNNYNFLEKILHLIALSSNFVKKILFSIEQNLFLTHKKKLDHSDRHIFISGLPRSGTTILLKNIYSSSEYASLTYKDMPFVLSPNIWHMININNKKILYHDRPHNDGIKNSIDSPEAFEEVFWKTFNDSDNIEKKFKDYIELILIKCSKSKYLSKNNWNYFRFKKIQDMLPNSICIVTYRDPLQHSYSLLNQHKNFFKLQSKDKFIKQYMDMLHHSEFGQSYTPNFETDNKYNNFFDINHWLEQWKKNYTYIYNNYSNNKNIFFYSYEELCSDQFDWKKFCGLLQIKFFIPKYNFKSSTTQIDDIYDEHLLNDCYALYKKMNIKN